MSEQKRRTFQELAAEKSQAWMNFLLRSLQKAMEDQFLDPRPASHLMDQITKADDDFTEAECLKQRLFGAPS